MTFKNTIVLVCYYVCRYALAGVALDLNSIKLTADCSVAFLILFYSTQFNGAIVCSSCERRAGIRTPDCCAPFCAMPRLNKMLVYLAFLGPTLVGS
jgi:hypothetical protein